MLVGFSILSVPTFCTMRPSVLNWSCYLDCNCWHLKKIQRVNLQENFALIGESSINERIYVVHCVSSARSDYLCASSVTADPNWYLISETPQWKRYLSEPADCLRNK